MSDMTSHATGYLVTRLFRDYIKPHMRMLWVALVLMICVGASTAGIAYMIEPMMDDIFVKKDMFKLIVIPLVIAAMFIFKGAANYGQSLIMKLLGQRLVISMQTELYEHLLRADIAQVMDESSGRLVSRFTNDINLLRNSASMLFTGLSKELITLFFLVGLMFYQNWKMALIGFFIFPVAIYPIVRLGKRMRKVSSQIQHELGGFTSQLDESFDGIKEIKLYQQEKREVLRVREILATVYAYFKKSAKTGSVSSPLMEALSGVTIAFVIWYGGFEVFNGNMTAGAFFSFMTAMLTAYKPLKNVSNLNTALQEGLAAAHRLFTLLDRKAEIVDVPNAQPIVLTKGEFVLKNVQFAYHGAEKSALQGVDLTIKGGTMVALVGPSGSGKSTIMNLLLRFYEPQSGEILLDGQNIQQVTTASLRSHMSMVSQNIVLFDDTIAANIAYSYPEATHEEIKAAAKNARADIFIEELPEGYDTKIGPNGFTLSGGQRQRIAIARAMLRNSPIILLDEATSALDPVSEKYIQEALSELMKGRTSLVIAHRLSTIKHADQIFVLDHGKVVESGKHDDLIQSDGPYSALYRGLASSDK